MIAIALMKEAVNRYALAAFFFCIQKAVRLDTASCRK
jgi:hypothetical protein